MFQPYPCPAIGQSYLAARRADVAAVVADHQNVGLFRTPPVRGSAREMVYLSRPPLEPGTKRLRRDG